MNENALAVDILHGVSEAFAPPKRIRVSEGAASILVMRQPGGYSGPWSATETPYMVEPMDLLASRHHEAVVFVGPARTGKTLGLLDGWLAHCVAHDPGDMLIVHMTQEKAREYSKIRVDRAIRHSPELKRRMSMRSHDDNTHDKLTKSGMWIKIGWPTASMLASSDYRYVALTDYDRMPENVDGEGAPFVLAVKRTQTFLSRGMCMVESSPGREYQDPNWVKGTPHEAPPASGVTGIYNRSDRRRWYWFCPDCSSPFEAAPGLSLFATLPSEEELLEVVRSSDLTYFAKKHAKICCPHCGSEIGPEHKHNLNENGIWVPDGVRVENGEFVGNPIEASIAGFWLGGVAAAYQNWQSILLRYLQGLRELSMTGSDLTLRTTINTDQALPYLPKDLVAGFSGDARKSEDHLERFVVPKWARFLVASVDVQGGKRAGFVVQVHAIGKDLESAVVDRYNITETPVSKGRLMDPAAYLEDWSVLESKLVNATYRIEDSEMELRILATGVDTGGEKGVTHNAYQWYVGLRKKGLGNRVFLLKGSSSKRRELIVSARARDARGRPIPQVRMYEVQTDDFKNQIATILRRDTPGPTYMHFPKWLPQSFYDELQAEVRGKDGKWKKIRATAKNETLDLWTYIMAVAFILGPADPKRNFDWDQPPAWAAPLEEGNSNVMTASERRSLKARAAPVKRKISEDPGLGSKAWVL